MKPSSIHQEAIQKREAHQSREALELYESALLDYIESENLEGTVRVLLEKVITLEHFFASTDRDIYLELAATTLQLAEYLVDKHEVGADLRIVMLRQVGSLSIIMGEIDDAGEAYEEAMGLAPKGSWQYADLQAHLAEVECEQDQFGQAESLFQQAIDRLSSDDNKGEVDERTRYVWLTGAYLRWADCLLGESQIDDARVLLEKAAEIIDQRQDLPRRKEQLDILQTALEEAIQRR